MVNEQSLLFIPVIASYAVLSHDRTNVDFVSTIYRPRLQGRADEAMTTASEYSTGE